MDYQLYSVLDTNGYSGGHSFVMLIEHSLNNGALCRSLDLVLGSKSDDEHSGASPLQAQLASCIPTIMKLMSSAKDRAILTFVLSSIFSKTSLTLTLGLQNNQIERIQQRVNTFLNEVDHKQELVEEEAQRQIENVISKLE